MNAINDYKRLKAEKVYSYSWANMLCKEYSGGGGGIGSISSIVFSKNEPIVLYYPERDGINNYHTIPACLLHYVGIAIKNNFSTILKQALLLQEKDIQKVAIAAKKEYELILKDAGLEETK